MDGQAVMTSASAGAEAELWPQQLEFAEPESHTCQVKAGPLVLSFPALGTTPRLSMCEVPPKG